MTSFVETGSKVSEIFFPSKILTTKRTGDGHLMTVKACNEHFVLWSAFIYIKPK